LHGQTGRFILSELEDGTNVPVDGIDVTFVAGESGMREPVIFLSSGSLNGRMNEKKLNSDTIEVACDSSLDSLGQHVQTKVSINAHQANTQFQVDAKPVDQNGVAAKLDYDWDRTWPDIELHGFSTGTVSSKSKDTLNNLTFGVGWKHDIARIYYVPLELNAKLENNQDFTVKDASAEAKISFPTRELGGWFRPGAWARFITGNNGSASPDPFLFISLQGGDRLSPADDTTKWFFRVSGGTQWRFPIIGKNYVTAQVQGWWVPTSKSRKTFSYVSVMYSQKISDDFAWTVKWINGELPPLFEKSTSFNIGFTVEGGKQESSP